jgi:biotin synthesis protein BioG
MKHKWLNKTNTEKLIIFFNGWGMDDFVVSELDCEDFNVVVLYDYNDLELDLDLSNFSQKHIIGWSMGVMISTLFDFDGVKTRSALCGTPKAIHDEFGIPERIYNLTVRGFSESSAQKFMERMFVSKPPFVKFSQREFESQKSELVKMLEYIKITPKSLGEFTRVIVPDSDKIIPTQNQLNYWKNRAEVIHSGHCPFGLYDKWSELI